MVQTNRTLALRWHNLAAALLGLLLLLGVPTAVVAANLADFAGVYEGTFSGDGQVSQWMISINEQGDVDGTFSGRAVVTADGQFSAAGPSAATFSGYISPQGDITGTWDRGTFDGKRTQLLDTLDNGRIWYIPVDSAPTQFSACGSLWTLEESENARVFIPTTCVMKECEVPHAVTLPYHINDGNKLTDYRRFVIGYAAALPHETASEPGGPKSYVRYHEYGHVFQMVTGQPVPQTPAARQMWEDGAHEYGSLITEYSKQVIGGSAEENSALDIQSALDYLFQVTGLPCLAESCNSSQNYVDGRVGCVPKDPLWNGISCGNDNCIGSEVCKDHTRSLCCKPDWGACSGPPGFCCPFGGQCCGADCCSPGYRCEGGKCVVKCVVSSCQPP